MREFRVLVVENERDWNERLVAMYRDIFGRIRPRVQVTVESARRGQEAVDLMRQNRYDLLSLDIILDGAEQQAAEDPGAKMAVGVDGRDLISLAKTRCHGVVVITGFAHDDEVSRLVEFDAAGRRRSNEAIEFEIRRERIAFDAFIADELGARGKCFHKDKDKDIDLTIRTIAERLHPKVLLSLCRPGNRFAKSRTNPKVWEIVFNGESFSIKDYKGMHMLAQLLREPGREFTADDLVPVDKGSVSYEKAAAEYGAMSEEESMLAGISRARGRGARVKVEGRGRASPDFAGEGVAELRREAMQIGELIEDLKEINDTIGIEKQVKRLAEIAELLRLIEAPAAFSDVDPATQKARKAVGKNIRDCLDSIKKQEEQSALDGRRNAATPIYDHLHASYVRNDGTFSYKPNPSVDWDVP